ncbi:MAG: hypothetical protein F6K19_05360 [Cyanothece sp. SIO1E1]|nr:hypothetical protein [Cyanothece sp. SIO1E1]
MRNVSLLIPSVLSALLGIFPSTKVAAMAIDFSLPERESPDISKFQDYGQKPADLRADVNAKAAAPSPRLIALSLDLPKVTSSKIEPSNRIKQVEVHPPTPSQSPTPDPLDPDSNLATAEVARQPPAPIQLNSQRQLEPAPSADITPSASSASADLDTLFAGGSDSLVAKAIGNAEGTRTPHGEKTSAYYGHVDPGNGVWNLGSFSYQHGAASPEAADVKQLNRLYIQAHKLRGKAYAKGLTLNLEEEINGMDLANQAPLAALGRGGYIDWLKQAHQMGLHGSEAVLWARTRSFLDPDTQQWNAPGLGNTVHGISHDQERRIKAIARALKANGY